MRTTDQETERIASVLSERYGLRPREVVRLPIGEGTANYRAACADRTVFVKQYGSDADLVAEAAATLMSRIAGGQGVPVPSVVPNRNGEAIDLEGALSVWEWVPGTVVRDRPTESQYHDVGAALGRIHRAFADLPGSDGPAPHVQRWRRRMDPRDLVLRVDQLRDIVTIRLASGAGDAFDELAATTLDERRAAVDRLPGLLAKLPDLTTQFLHGDYTFVNVLFDGARLVAVTDFRPPDPFLVAYELGRVAFSPNAIVTDPDWLGGARTLVLGYLDTGPGIRADDVRACARVALLQLLRSLYGVKEHYLRPSLFQDELDRFWLHRHRSVTVLLEHLDDIETMLAQLAIRASAS
jgi:Ser/Thr protein kinase RdoA (MazF antagonist)